MTSPSLWGSSQQSAFDIIQNQLNQWGIGSLSDVARLLIVQGLDANAVTLELQNTPAYQQRFAANATRIKNGLAALAPADYVAAETSYKNVLRQYGLPSGFYDTPTALNQFIANDVSPSELQSRAQIAQQIWLSNDQETKDAWRSFYGLSDGSAIAAILDPNEALPIVQREANAAKWGGEATRLGLDADQQRLEQYSDLGYTDAQVNKGLQQTAVEQQSMQNIAQRFGQQYTQGTAEKANIMGDAQASLLKNNLMQSESALFSSRAMADSAALQRSAGGQF